MKTFVEQVNPQSHFRSWFGRISVHVISKVLQQRSSREARPLTSWEGGGTTARHTQGRLFSTLRALASPWHAARTALMEAGADRKLRRALLRRYAGQNRPFFVGQHCHCWRDAGQADLIKISAQHLS